MTNLKIVFFGTPHFVVPVLQKLTDNFQVVGVVTSLTPQKLDEEFAQKLKALQPDLITVAAYGKIIPASVLDIPKYGALNVHPSLLPKYRGASPIQAAILNGDEISGVTIIKMDASMDHGPIVSTKEVILSEKDTFETLSKIMFEAGADLLVQAIPDYIDNKIDLVVQDDAMATYCPIIKKEDGYFDINNPPPPQQLDRMVRAYYPWPTAWTKWRGKIVKLLPNQMVQMEGKKPTTLQDFLRGYCNFPLKLS